MTSDIITALECVHSLTCRGTGTFLNCIK